MKEANTNSAASGVTPGVLLKAAREEQGLSVVDIAARLCLNVQFVEDIERDDYSQMSARVYARGHVLSYANLLGIPESQILPALVNVNMHFEPVKTQAPVENEHPIPIYQSPEGSSQSRSSLLLWISVLVLIILIGLVVLWWKGPSAVDLKSPNGGARSTEVDIQPQNQNTAPAAPAAAPETNQPATAPLPPPASTSTTAPADQATQPAPVSAPAPTPAPASSQTEEQNVVQPSELRDNNNSADQSSSVALPPPTSTKLKKHRTN